MIHKLIHFYTNYITKYYYIILTNLLIVGLLYFFSCNIIFSDNIWNNLAILLVFTGQCYHQIKQITTAINIQHNLLTSLYINDTTKMVMIYDYQGKVIYYNSHLKLIHNIPDTINELYEHDYFKNYIAQLKSTDYLAINLEDTTIYAEFECIISYTTKDNNYRIFEFRKNQQKSCLQEALDVLENFDIPALICDDTGSILAKNSVVIKSDIEVDHINLNTIAYGRNISFSFDKLYRVKRLNAIHVKNCLIVLFPLQIGTNEIWAFLQRSTLGAAILDLNFNIIKFNQQFNILTNNDEQACGKNLLSYIDAEELNKIKTLANDRLDNRVSGPVEISINAQEKSFIVHINIMEFDGSLTYVLSVIDTTKYKTLEMNFVHSQKMQAVGQLAGAIAHDFNNLLTAMVGFCDLLLLRHPPGDRSFGELMQIKQNVNRAANLVRQLLAFSRKQVLRPNILEVTNIIAEISNLISRLIGENIELKIEHGNDLDYIKVDQGQFEQVIINLAVNSRDAMPNGGVLKIVTSNIIVDEDFSSKSYIAPVGDESIAYGEYILIEISDNGSGIPKDVLNKIFEPFFSTKAIGAGTGLGLSTALGIVKQTGGYIRLITQENVGTQFFIFLKAIKPSEANMSEQTINTSLIDDNMEKNDSDQNWRGKILIVEDENPVRIFSVHALIAKGYEVLEADCADVALTIMAKDGADIKLIITDVMMPGMTGPKMIEEICKTHPHIKVLYISGYAEDALNSYTTDDKEFNFLPKPFTLKQLANKVKEVTML